MAATKKSEVKLAVVQSLGEASRKTILRLAKHWNELPKCILHALEVFRQ